MFLAFISLWYIFWIKSNKPPVSWLCACVFSYTFIFHFFICTKFHKIYIYINCCHKLINWQLPAKCVIHISYFKKISAQIEFVPVDNAAEKKYSQYKFLYYRKNWNAPLAIKSHCAENCCWLFSVLLGSIEKWIQQLFVR